MQDQLDTILEACLHPQSINAAQDNLRRLSCSPGFVVELLILLPRLSGDRLLMALVVLKNFLVERYVGLQEEIKCRVRGCLLEMYYEVEANQGAIKLYKQIIRVVIIADYPWKGIDQAIRRDLDNKVEASVYFIGQVAQVYCRHRGCVSVFWIEIQGYFLSLQIIVEQILANFNSNTSKLLQQVLQTFLSCCKNAIPTYFRDFNRLECWLHFMTVIFSTNNGLLALSQTIISHIYFKLFTIFCDENRDGNDYRGWANHFIRSQAGGLTQHVCDMILGGLQTDETLAVLIDCLCYILPTQQLRNCLPSHSVQAILYGQCLLMRVCKPTRQQWIQFQTEQMEYVRRQEDENCFVVRRAFLRLVQLSVSYPLSGESNELSKIVSYCVSILSNQQSEDQSKIAVIRIFSVLSVQLLKDRSFKRTFETYVVNLFSPLLMSTNKLMVSLLYQLLRQFLPFVDLSEPTVTSLLDLLSPIIICQSSVVLRYEAVLTFSGLLESQVALASARPYFSQILHAYVRLLDVFDHQNIVQCLQSLIKYFQPEMIKFAPDLLKLFLRMFRNLFQVEQEDNCEVEENLTASAIICTLKEILKSGLAFDVYLQVSGEIVDLLRNVVGLYANLVGQILELFAVLCHKGKILSDFEYPYVLCRRFLEGDQFKLNSKGLAPKIVEELNNTSALDGGYQDIVLSILKNIIKYAPDSMLQKYSWPRHPQLLLALLQNNRLQNWQQQLLIASQRESKWKPYLEAYSFAINGVGQLRDINQLTKIVGVSLSPWLSAGITPGLVRAIVDSVEDQREQEIQEICDSFDNFDINQEEEHSLHDPEGTDYSYYYDSPYSSGGDKISLVAQINRLRQQKVIELVNSLSCKYQRKLKVLMESPFEGVN